ncbi:MAG: hypothetical protein ACSLE0_02235, partial [Chitinophagaceae bacterium]
RAKTMQRITRKILLRLNSIQMLLEESWYSIRGLPTYYQIAPEKNQSSQTALQKWYGKILLS